MRIRLPTISPSTTACSPRISVPLETNVPFIAESIRKVPEDSSLPSSLTPRSRNPVHSADSCCLCSNHRHAMPRPFALELLFSHELAIQPGQIGSVVVLKRQLAWPPRRHRSNMHLCSELALQLLQREPGVGVDRGRNCRCF